MPAKLRPFTIVLVFLAIGCLKSTRPPQASKSAFYTSCSDVNALLTRAATDNGCAVKNSGAWSSGSWKGSRIHNISGMACNVVPSEGQSDGKVLGSLKAQVQALAQQAGADIIDTSEGTGIDGSPSGFEMAYGIGNAHGKIEVNFEKAAAQPDNPSPKGHQLRMKIEEMAG